VQQCHALEGKEYLIWAGVAGGGSLLALGTLVLKGTAAVVATGGGCVVLGVAVVALLCYFLLRPKTSTSTKVITFTKHYAEEVKSQVDAFIGGGSIDDFNELCEKMLPMLAALKSEGREGVECRVCKEHYDSQTRAPMKSQGCGCENAFACLHCVTQNRQLRNKALNCTACNQPTSWKQVPFQTIGIECKKRC